MTTVGSIAKGERSSAAVFDDVALLGRVAGRDDAAFEALYRSYYPRLRRFLERVTRRPQIVEEILDDTMLVVWRKAPEFKLRSKVSTWIFGIALRRALKTLERLDEPVEFDAERNPESSDAPERVMLVGEMRAHIAQALCRLSPDHRTVIELTYFEGRSCSEIAEIMRCPVNTVKTRTFHARQRIRTLIAEEEGPEGCR